MVSILQSCCGKNEQAGGEQRKKDTAIATAASVPLGLAHGCGGDEREKGRRAEEKRREGKYNRVQVDLLNFPRKHSSFYPFLLPTKTFSDRI